MQRFKVSDHSVPKTDWKQTDGQTDGVDCITSLANAVGNQDALSLCAQIGQINPRQFVAGFIQTAAADTRRQLLTSVISATCSAA